MQQYRKWKWYRPLSTCVNKQEPQISIQLVTWSVNEITKCKKRLMTKMYLMQINN